MLDAHRSYLATRDIATINVLLLIPAPLLALWMTGDVHRAGIYGLALLGSYLVFAVAAKNYAQRMVQNVLACASCAKVPASGNA